MQEWLRLSIGKTCCALKSSCSFVIASIMTFLTCAAFVLLAFILSSFERGIAASPLTSSSSTLFSSAAPAPCLYFYFLLWFFLWAASYFLLSRMGSVDSYSSMRGVFNT